MATVLLTLGRLPKALDLARGFAALGHRVVVAEPFARHLTGISRAVARQVRVTPPAEDPARYRADLLRVAAEERADLILPVSEETMHVGHLAGALPPGTRLAAMPPDALLAMHDKRRFVEVAREAGVAVPETAVLGSAAAAALAARADHVVKPILSCSGRGVRFRAAGEPLPLEEHAAIVQRRIPGAVHSSFSLVHHGRVLVTVVYRAALLSGTVAVVFERVADQPGIEAWIARMAAHLGWSGFLSFDFVLDPEGVPWGIECNPRATSGVHFLDAASLAAAVLDPEAAPPPRLRPDARLQQFYAVLTEAQGAILRRDWGRYRQSTGLLLRTRDVTWSWRDPLPFLTMTWTAWPIIAAARRRGVPLGEVATLDIGWYGEAAPTLSAAAAAP